MMQNIFVKSENLLYTFLQDRVLMFSNPMIQKSVLIESQPIRFVDKNPVFYAGIAITNQCNLSCKHCIVETSKSKNKLTSYSIIEIKELVKTLHKQGLTRVTITGGEPFMYPHLKDLFEFMGELKVESKINTNGTVLNFRLIERLIENGLTEIDISLNSLNNDSFVYFDGLNQTDKRINSIKELSKLAKDKCTITISSILTDEILDNLETIEDFLHSIGVYSWRLRELMPSSNPNREVPKEIICNDYKLINRLTEYSRKEKKIKVWGYLFNCIKNKSITMRCQDLISNYLFFDEKKNVYYMPELNKANLGVFEAKSFTDSLISLQELKKTELNYPNRCKLCPSRSFCLMSTEISTPYLDLKKVLKNEK